MPPDHSVYPCCMFMLKSMLQVLAARPCCMSKELVNTACQNCVSFLHDHARWPCNMPTLHVHVVCPCACPRQGCSSILHGLGACLCSMYVLHAHVNAACHVLAACRCCMFFKWKLACPCCMSMTDDPAACPDCMSLILYLSLLHVHAAFPPCISLHVRVACPCCLFMLLVHADFPCCKSMLHICAACPCYISVLHVHAACFCCISVLHIHASCPWCMPLMHVTVYNSFYWFIFWRLSAWQIAEV
jgi:hypothetical protein